MAKSKAEKKKQKRQTKIKQIKSSKSLKNARENGYFHLQDASYFYNTGELDRAVKSIKKAAKALPHEEEVFQLMGYIASRNENTLLELSAMAGMERIGKITDDMRIDRVVKLVNLGRYKECVAKADWVLENLTRLKIKNKRHIKVKMLDIKEYCQALISMKMTNFSKNTLSSPAPLNKTKQLPKNKPIQVPEVSPPPKSPMFPSFTR